MPLTLCIHKEFLIESKLNGFFFSVTFGLKIFIGESRDEVKFYMLVTTVYINLKLF